MKIKTLYLITGILILSLTSSFASYGAADFPTEPPQQKVKTLKEKFKSPKKRTKTSDKDEQKIKQLIIAGSVAAVVSRAIHYLYFFTPLLTTIYAAPYIGIAFGVLTLILSLVALYKIKKSGKLRKKRWFVYGNLILGVLPWLTIAFLAFMMMG